MSGPDKGNEREDANGEVKKKNRVGQVGDHLLGQFRAVGVVLGQQSETLINPSALLAGGDERGVEFRQPLSDFQNGFGKREALGEFADHALDGFAIGTGGRISLYVVQRFNQADSGGSELVELVVKFGAVGELSGCDNERHNASRPAFAQAATRSKLNLRSRLLRRPTICSVTSPLEKSSSVGMARTPYSAAMP